MDSILALIATLGKNRFSDANFDKLLDNQTIHLMLMKGAIVYVMPAFA